MKAWLALPGLLLAASCRTPAAPAKKTAASPPPKPTDFIEFSFPNQGEIQGACWIPQRNQLVASIKPTQELAVLTLGKTLDLKLIAPNDHELFFFTPVPSPDGSMVAVDDCGATGPSELFIFNTADWSLRHRLGGGEDRLTPRWTEDSKTLYAASFQRALKFDSKTGKQIGKYETDTLREEFGSTDYADTGDPSIISVDDTKNPVYYVDIDTGKRVEPKNPVSDPPVRTSPQGQRQVSRTPDKTTYRVLENGESLDITSSRDYVSQEFGFMTETIFSSAGPDLQLISTLVGKSIAALVFFVSEEDQDYNRKTLDWAIILADGRFTGSPTADSRITLPNARRDDPGVLRFLKEAFAT